jgi:hypothetical protein
VGSQANRKTGLSRAEDDANEYPQRLKGFYLDDAGRQRFAMMIGASEQ